MKDYLHSAKAYLKSMNPFEGDIGSTPKLIGLSLLALLVLVLVTIFGGWAAHIFTYEILKAVSQVGILIVSLMLIYTMTKFKPKRPLERILIWREIAIAFIILRLFIYNIFDYSEPWIVIVSYVLFLVTCLMFIYVMVKDHLTGEDA